MILKIRENHLYVNAGWFVISGVAGISYSSKMAGVITSETLAEAWLPKEEVNDDGYLVEKASCKHRYFPPDNKSGEWIRILVDFIDGRKEEWVVQAETYLLNDDGKTIERIFG